MTVGLNDEGLTRREWSSERMSVLRTALVTFLNKGEKGLESDLKQLSNSVDVQVLFDFIKGSARNICSPKTDLKAKLVKL
jgi:acyl-[acyl carrier protein]--UDP-N-acetylglucosamine O-acyltransferase